MRKFLDARGLLFYEGATNQPTTEPTSKPTNAPTKEPTSEPTNEPTKEPTNEPTTEPTSKPTNEPTSTPCHFSCLAAKASGVTRSGLLDVCPTGDRGDKLLTVLCDQETEGGGWMLFFSYNHIGGENELINGNVLPTSATDGYSYQNLDKTGYSLVDIEALRFYCHTSGHGRKIHFSTNNAKIKEIGHTGNSIGNTPAIWTNVETTTLLGGHTGILPLTTEIETKQSNDGGLHSFPFYKDGTSHWGVRGGGDRWECDNYPDDRSKDTLHNIWARIPVETKS
jgi:hypothetical protein